MTAASESATEHWLQQRLTAGSGLFLILWFIVSLALLPAYDFETFSAWLSSPWAAVPLLLLVISMFYHARLGLQVVIEDYQGGDSRVALMVLVNFLTVTLTVLAVFSILKVAFTAGAA